MHVGSEGSCTSHTFSWFIRTTSRRRQASTPSEDGFCSVRHIELSLQLDFAARICIKFAVSIPISDGVQFSAVEHAHCSVERGIVNHTHAYPVTSPEVHSLSIRCTVGNSPSCLRKGASQTSACHRRCAASLQLASRKCRSIAGFERHTAAKWFILPHFEHVCPSAGQAFLDETYVRSQYLQRRPVPRRLTIGDRFSSWRGRDFARRRRLVGGDCFSSACSSSESSSLSADESRSQPHDRWRLLSSPSAFASAAVSFWSRRREFRARSDHG